MDPSHITFLDETVNMQLNEFGLHCVSAGGGIRGAAEISVCRADDWRRRSHSYRLLAQRGPDKDYSSQGLQGDASALPSSV